jgi:Peptidase family M23
MTLIRLQSAVSHDADTTKIAQRHLAGQNRWGVDWDPGPIDGSFGRETGRACQRAKWYLGYLKADCTPIYGPRLNSYLVQKADDDFEPLGPNFRTRKAQRKGKPNPFAQHDGYPLAVHGQVIGVPYVGTHLLFGNWESDNAVDIAVQTGTPVLAVRDGVIGSQIGPLQTSGDPRLLGLRLHLKSDVNEWYYAHLSHLDVVAGQHVREGQQLGLSGSANGVEHLHLGQEHGDPGITIGSPSPGYWDRHYPG